MKDFNSRVFRLLAKEMKVEDLAVPKEDPAQAAAGDEAEGERGGGGGWDARSTASSLCVESARAPAPSRRLPGVRLLPLLARCPRLTPPPLCLHLPAAEAEEETAGEAGEADDAAVADLAAKIKAQAEAMGGTTIEAEDAHVEL